MEYGQGSNVQMQGPNLTNLKKKKIETNNFLNVMANPLSIFQICVYSLKKRVRQAKKEKKRKDKTQRKRNINIIWSSTQPNIHPKII